MTKKETWILYFGIKLNRFLIEKNGPSSKPKRVFIFLLYMFDLKQDLRFNQFSLYRSYWEIQFDQHGTPYVFSIHVRY